MHYEKLAKEIQTRGGEISGVNAANTGLSETDASFVPSADTTR